MVEEQRSRVDEAMTKMLEDVDKSHLRLMQAKMFRCAATCCEDKEGSLHGVKRCIENCGLPLQNAQNYVQQEFQHLQDRLQRCVMSCNDNIRDKMGANASESELSKYTKEFEGCAKKCVDTHIDLVPSTLKKMRDFLNKKEFSAH